ncbi:MAG: type II toxin-antitoxin system RelE/ParE family toxin [Xanthobacteraceae bacterium]|uniref:type II toxin-antitoxin system RelE/ParE family toxin n=1 Tax=Pseudolabrys sp. TaxID=1960880 RepID=UPI003D0E891C
MVEISKTDDFDGWLRSLKDSRARAKILIRIDRLADGNAGDVAPIGSGASEMRIHYGPGYRVYYKLVGNAATILCAGDKSTQSADIAKALEIAKELEI